MFIPAHASSFAIIPNCFTSVLVKSVTLFFDHAMFFLTLTYLSSISYSDFPFVFPNYILLSMPNLNLPSLVSLAQSSVKQIAPHGLTLSVFLFPICSFDLTSKILSYLVHRNLGTPFFYFSQSNKPAVIAELISLSTHQQQGEKAKGACWNLTHCQSYRNFLSTLLSRESCPKS